MKACQKQFICLILVVRDSTIEALREALEDVNHRLAGQAGQEASIANQQPPLPPPPTSPPPGTMPVSVEAHVAIPVVDFTAAPAASTAVPAASTAAPTASTAAPAASADGRGTDESTGSNTNTLRRYWSKGPER